MTVYICVEVLHALTWECFPKEGSESKELFFTAHTRIYWVLIVYQESCLVLETQIGVRNSSWSLARHTTLKNAYLWRSIIEINYGSSKDPKLFWHFSKTEISYLNISRIAIKSGGNRRLGHHKSLPKVKKKYDAYSLLLCKILNNRLSLAFLLLLIPLIPVSLHPWSK